MSEIRRMSKAEAQAQIDAIATFLQLARQILKGVEIPQLYREISLFDSFAPILDPTAWMSGRNQNRDLAEWLDAIAPLKAKLDLLEAGTSGNL